MLPLLLGLGVGPVPWEAAHQDAADIGIYPRDSHNLEFRFSYCISARGKNSELPSLSKDIWHSYPFLPVIPYARISPLWLRITLVGAKCKPESIVKQCSLVNDGSSNEAKSPVASISGGSENWASSPFSSISGGNDNRTFGEHSSVSGGLRNTTSEAFSAVSGGEGNHAFETASPVSGGLFNRAGGRHSTVSGGFRNRAEDARSTVSGGHQLVAFGNSHVHS